MHRLAKSIMARQPALFDENRPHSGPAATKAGQSENELQYLQWRGRGGPLLPEALKRLPKSHLHPKEPLDKSQFDRNLDQRCRAFNDGEDLVAGQAPKYVQLGQDPEAGNGPGRVHDVATVRARALFGRAIHPANSDLLHRQSVIALRCR